MCRPRGRRAVRREIEKSPHSVYSSPSKRWLAEDGQDGVVEALRGVAVGDADPDVVEHVAEPTRGSLHQIRRPAGRGRRARSAARSPRASRRGPQPSATTAFGRHDRLAARSRGTCRAATARGPGRCRRARWRARTCGRSRSPARRRPSAPRSPRRRRAARGRRRAASASPPPAKAAIVIAAPAQARPPAARLVALTPPAVGGGRRPRVAHERAPRRPSSSAMPGHAASSRFGPPSSLVAAGARCRRRAPPICTGRIRVRLLADEAVVDLVVPAAGGREHDRGAIDAGLAGRLGGERLRRVAVADRHGRLDVRPAASRPCWSTVMFDVPRLPRRRPGGRRAQPDGRPPTRMRGGSERPAAVQRRAAHGARRLLFLEHRPYTATPTVPEPKGVRPLRLSDPAIGADFVQIEPKGVRPL